MFSYDAYNRHEQHKTTVVDFVRKTLTLTPKKETGSSNIVRAMLAGNSIMLKIVTNQNKP
jgi:predicted SnoaL-like aldol condensation-catalyzing enzyme